MSDFDEPYNEDEDYDDDQYYPGSQDKFESQHINFQFDITSWNNWLLDALEKLDTSGWSFSYIPAFPFKSLPVNDYFSSTGSFKNSLYLGNNHYKEPIYKTKYFIHDKLQNDYKNHLVSNAVYFVQQPNYYKGMFDILN